MTGDGWGPVVTLDELDRVKKAIADEQTRVLRRLNPALKRDINALVWRHLPGDTTLDQADAVACAIYDILTEAVRL